MENEVVTRNGSEVLNGNPEQIVAVFRSTVLLLNLRRIHPNVGAIRRHESIVSCIGCELSRSCADPVNSIRFFDFLPLPVSENSIDGVDDGDYDRSYRNNLVVVLPEPKWLGWVWLFSGVFTISSGIIFAGCSWWDDHGGIGAGIAVGLILWGIGGLALLHGLSALLNSSPTHPALSVSVPARLDSRPVAMPLSRPSLSHRAPLSAPPGVSSCLL